MPACAAITNCYFCAMLCSDIVFKRLFLLLAVVLVTACEGLFNTKEEKEPIARVGDNYLYKNDVAAMMRNDISAQDSAFFVANYINTWAAKQLLLSKAKINLAEDKLSEYDRLVADYKTDLYTRAYIDALVQQSSDTSISESQLRDFYDKEKENFRVDEKLLRLRFVALPNQFLDKEVVVEKLRRFEPEDKLYLDSIAVQFKKIHLNDSIWVSASRVIEEIPPLKHQNLDRHLKKSQFFELQDSLGVYLGKVTDELEVNEVAPISYITPKIKQILLNRRRLNYIRRLETEIIDEAIKKNEFEVYGKE